MKPSRPPARNSRQYAKGSRQEARMKLFLITLTIVAALSLACTAPRPGTPANEAPQRVEDVKGPSATAAQCEAGKEPSRAQGAPKRGGTFTMGVLDIADLDQNA